MATSDRRLVLIHGLPSLHTDPIRQLDAIRPIGRDCGMVEVPFQWAHPTYKGIAEVGKQLKRHDASFALTHADSLQTKVFDGLPRDVRIEVVAYSLGGAIFYRWVTDVANSADLDRVDVALMIGAPHTFPDELSLEQYPSVHFPVRERPINQEAIIENLARSGTRLQVVLAGQDRCIVRPVSDFEPAACLEQVVIPDAGHLSVLTHPTLLELARRWLD